MGVEIRSRYVEAGLWEGNVADLGLGEENHGRVRGQRKDHGK
jgi:hypothetical protein